MITAMRTPAALNTAITQEAVPSPADNASDGDPPAAVFETVTEL